jgi:hypothetical protein
MIRKPLLMIVQSLKAPHKRIAQEFRSLVTDFTTYHIAFESGYNEAVAEVMGKLHGLDCLDPEDTARISPTINDAARCYYSVHWWPLFREAIRKRYRMQAAIVLATILFILLSWNILPKPRTANMTVDNISSVVILAEVLVAAGAVFYFLIPCRALGRSQISHIPALVGSRTSRTGGASSTIYIAGLAFGVGLHSYNCSPICNFLREGDRERVGVRIWSASRAMCRTSTQIS